jgi:hypothetical protein
MKSVLAERLKNMKVFKKILHYAAYLLQVHLQAVQKAAKLTK